MLYEYFVTYPEGTVVANCDDRFVESMIASGHAELWEGPMGDDVIECKRLTKSHHKFKGDGKHQPLL